MKMRRIMAFAAMAALVAAAPSPSCADIVMEDGGTNVVLVTRLADGSTNAWTQVDLVDALGMVNRKYHRDMATDQGRRKWHGAIVPEKCTIVTNADGKKFRRDVYADGYFHDTPFTPKPTLRPRGNRSPFAAEERYANLTNRLAEVEAKVASGDPSSLQYAKDLMEAHRLRRMVERESARRTTNTVSVTVTPQGGE
mgnify:FL=1